MYTRPRFLEELHAIREEMSRECDYDMDLFAQSVNESNQEQDIPVDSKLHQEDSNLFNNL